MAEKQREAALRYLLTNWRFRPKLTLMITDAYAALSAMPNQPFTPYYVIRLIYC